MEIGQHQQTAEALSADLYTGAKLQLLTGDGSLGDRLVSAYFEMAIHAAPLAQQLPGDFGPRVLSLHSALTGGGASHDTPDRAAVAGAVGAMGNDERIRIALDIAELADDLDTEIRATNAVNRPAD